MGLLIPGSSVLNRFSSSVYKSSPSRSSSSIKSISSSPKSLPSASPKSLPSSNQSSSSRILSLRGKTRVGAGGRLTEGL